MFLYRVYKSGKDKTEAKVYAFKVAIPELGSFRMQFFTVASLGVILLTIVISWRCSHGRIQVTDTESGRLRSGLSSRMWLLDALVLYPFLERTNDCYTSQHELQYGAMASPHNV